MNELKKLVDVYPGWLTTGGIFSELASLPGFVPPWAEMYNPLSLDIAYYGNHSGDKIISPLVEKILVDGVLTPNNAQILATICAERFGVNWAKIWATQELEYNPIENYSMTETGEDTDKNTGTVKQTEDITHTGTGTRETSETNKGTVTEAETETPGEVITKVTDGQAKQDTAVFGFNADPASPVPSDTQSGTNKVTDTETHSGTVKRDKTTTNDLILTGGEDTTENHTDTRDGTRTDDLTRTGAHTLKRSGNIGVTTSQEMIQSERDLWVWNFLEMVFNDVDKVLTLPIY